MPRNAAVFRGDSICRCPWAHSRFVTNGRPTIYWIVLKFFLFCFSSLSPLRKHYAAAPNGIYIEINLIFKCIALVHKWKRAKRKKKLSDILVNELQRRAMWQMCWACCFAVFFYTSASTTNNNESKNEGKIEIARACKRDAIAIVDNNKHNE